MVVVVADLVAELVAHVPRKLPLHRAATTTTTTWVVQMNDRALPRARDLTVLTLAAAGRAPLPLQVQVE